MRLPFFTLFVSNLVLFFLYPTLVLAIHPYALARREHKPSPAPQVLTSRQHRVVRDLLDVCINLNVNLLADASQLLGLGSLLGPLDALANIQLCLCLKDLDIYLDTNDEIQVLVGLLGKNAISALITALINTSPEAQQCTFPPNAHHTCNNVDPCHYECDSHFVRSGDTCVCAPPYITCNGVCDLFPQGCSSAVPRALKARSAPITTFAQAKASCSSQQTLCGIRGFEETLAFECIDTTVKKDSCGGCMAPHPFFEPKAVHRSSGVDCSAIPRAQSTSCVQSTCVVHSCKEGWIPSAQADKCIPPAQRNPIMRVQKRSSSEPGPLSVNATADVNISSDLLTQIISIVDMVLKLPTLAPAPSSSQPSAATTSNEISALIGKITDAVGNLLNSATVSSLVESIDALLSSCNLLRSTLAKCGCVQGLGIDGLVQELDQLIDDVLSMQRWCKDHPVIAGGPTSPGNGQQPPAISSSPDLPEQPIVIGLSSLLTALGLNGNSGVIVGGLGNGLSSAVNGILNSLSLGPNNYNITGANPTPTVGSDLLAQIVGLVNQVLELQGNSGSLPPLPVSSAGSTILSPIFHPAPTSSSHPGQSPSGSPSVDVGLIATIVQAVLDILHSPTISALVSAVDGLVDANSQVRGALGQCDCVDALGLKPLVANLYAIDNAALEMQDWCRKHLVGVSPSSTTNLNDDPIIVGLSDLLTSLGLLGPVKAVATVDGLGSGLSDLVNGLLAGLGIGPLNVRRDDGLPLSADANAIAKVNSDLLAQIEDIIGLVVKVKGSCTSFSPSHGPSSTSPPPVDPALVKNIVQAAADLLQSPTVNSLVASTDRLINACTALSNLLAGCDCVESLGLGDVVEYLVRIIEAALGLKSRCTANPIAIHSEAIGGTTLSINIPTHTRTVAPVPISSTIPSSLPTTESGDIPIVLGLNHLLNGLGLGSIKSVTSIDLLGNGIDSAVNGLLDGLGIGPHDVRRRRPTKRQYSTQADSQLPTEVYFLIDLSLGLSDAGSSLSPTPALSPIDTELVVRVVRATGQLLSSKSADQLLNSVDALVRISTLSLEAIQGCKCIAEMGLDRVEGYLTQIVSVSKDIQSWAHGHYVLSPSVKPTAVHSPHNMANVSDNASTLNAAPLLPGLQLLVDGILGLGESGLKDGLVSAVNDLLLPPPASSPRTIISSASWKRRS
ncbi:hypothetical protein M413DRAFT_387205 [Hebeloma cylindrosporum]|uniref:Protein CPL1-like domain-containing protein n=1 Tax=Hebeloma cylindrosporum TaxID=76867 RepID=A0A0C2Y1I9_HEBCY|nr:hypothetical protein M413DRAFT_387205 [Hebeloma cylindrosporum h7]